MPRTAILDRQGTKWTVERIDQAPDLEILETFGVPRRYLRVFLREKVPYPQLLQQELEDAERRVESLRRQLQKGNPFEGTIGSVTEFLQLPRISRLKAEHDYATDVSKTIYQVFGTAAHAVVEAEKDPLVIQFGEHKLAGTADDFWADHVFDYKTASVYPTVRIHESDVRTEKPDYFWQLQAYAEGYRQRGQDVQGLRLVMMLKDWDTKEAEATKKWYPPAWISFPVPVLPSCEVQEFWQQLLAERLTAADLAEPPPCPTKELWYPENPKNRWFGTPLRCRFYCEVSKFCDQWATLQGEKP